MAAFPISADLPEILRETIQSQIEHLIGVLDFLDTDPDLEDGADAEPDQDGEPSLGSLDAQSQSRWSGGISSTEDYEQDEADDEDGGDREPSLGSLSANIHQDLWGRFGFGQDLEDDHDGREPCCEDEGAQCDDEGIDDDREPDVDAEGWCHSEFSDYYLHEQRERVTPPRPTLQAVLDSLDRVVEATHV